MPSLNTFDQIFRTFVVSKLFTKGWGDTRKIKRLIEFREHVRDRNKCFKFVSSSHPVYIDKEEKDKDCHIIEGHFTTPFIDCVPDVVPPESHTAYFQLVLPQKWKTSLKPVCLHLAGTGDHRFWRRRKLLAEPLLKEAGIASIILENPFYGSRKPKDQIRSSLHNVSDIFVMGGCLAMESIVLFHWCERQGFGPLGVTGISMGGHMASIAASVWPKPIALIPCLSWTTASCVFTQGVMSDGIPWNRLQDQFVSDVCKDELIGMISTLKNDEAFHAGQQFARNYPVSMAHYQNIKKDGDIKGASEIPSMKACTNENHHNSSTNVNLLARPIEENNLRPNDSTLSPIVTNAAAASAPIKPSTSSSFSIINPLLSPVLERRAQMKEKRMEALQFMRGIMDEFTHLGNFSVPVDPSLIIIVTAQGDAYVLREGITDLTDIWKGAEVRFIDAGHITAFLFKQSVFRKAIVDAFDRLAKKYYRTN